jgi:hypothetical protein
MFEYVLVLYLNDQATYLGNFESCAHATKYFNNCVINTVRPKEWSTACLYQDYIFLPEGFVPIHPEDCTSK